MGNAQRPLEGGGGDDREGGGGPVTIFRDRFVFNRRTGAFFAASREGAFILRAAWDGQDRYQIEKGLARAFGISAALATSDTERFLLRLRELNLLPQDREGAR